MPGELCLISRYEFDTFLQLGPVGLSSCGVWLRIEKARWRISHARNDVRARRNHGCGETDERSGGRKEVLSCAE